MRSTHKKALSTIADHGSISRVAVRRTARAGLQSPDKQTAIAGRPVRLPLFLSLKGKKVLVVGGGNVAATKVLAILTTGAIVTLIAPRVIPAAMHEGITIIRRQFRATDLDGAWFVVAAATPAVNARVVRAADRRRIFVNSVDDSPNGSAHFSSVIRRGELVLALSTGGTAPAMACLMREAIEVLLPPEIDKWIAMAQVERKRWLRKQVPIARRVPLLAAAICKLYGANKRSRQ